MLEDEEKSVSTTRGSTCTYEDEVRVERGDTGDGERRTREDDDELDE